MDATGLKVPTQHMLAAYERRFEALENARRTLRSRATNATTMRRLADESKLADEPIALLFDDALRALNALRRHSDASTDATLQVLVAQLGSSLDHQLTAIARGFCEVEEKHRVAQLADAVLVPPSSVSPPPPQAPRPESPRPIDTSRRGAGVYEFVANLCESLVSTLQCQCVRLYIRGRDAPSALLYEAPIAAPGALDRIAAAVPQRLGREVERSVFEHRIAVSATAAATTTVAASPRQRSCIIWPVVAPDGGRIQVVGAIECVGKLQADELPDVGGAYRPRAAPAFTSADEAVVVSAARLLVSALSRSDGALTIYSAAAARAMNRVADGVARAQRGEVAALQFSANSEVQRTTEWALRAADAAATVHVFRAPCAAIFAATTEGLPLDGVDVGTTQRILSRAQAGPGLPLATAFVNDGKLRTIESSVVALEAMWRDAFAENVKMHHQSRQTAERVRDLSAVCARVDEMFAHARRLDTVSEIRDYLRSAEMTLRRANAASSGTVGTNSSTTVASAAAGNGSSNHGSAAAGPATARPPSVPGIDGPEGVRRYTAGSTKAHNVGAPRPPSTASSSASARLSKNRLIY